MAGVVALAVGAAVTRREARGAWYGWPEFIVGDEPSDPPRLLAPVALPVGPSHLGVRWEGAHDVLLEVRWRRAGEPWGDWRRLERAHDLGDAARGVWLSGLLIVAHPADAQLRLLHGAVDKITLIPIDAAAVLAGAAQGRYHTAGTDAAPPASPRAEGPVVVSRREWGADESLRRGHRSFAPITRVSVHHTVTPNNDPDPASTVRAILAYHVQGNGWDDIGYNFLIDAQGRIYEGRWARDYPPGETPTGENDHGYGVIGAHTGRDNPGTVGVALLGDFRSVAPSPAALDALETLLAWEADRHHIEPLATTAWSSGERSTIIGHRDASATACPGDELYAALPTVRRSVADRLAAPPASGPTPGYWLLTRDGQVSPYGKASTPASAAAPAPAVSLAATPSGQGYWVLSGNGEVVGFGDARSFGSTEAMDLNAPVVRIEPTPSGRGYWIVAADGGVFAFGDAQFHGTAPEARRSEPVVALMATPSGDGYWIVAADGEVFGVGAAKCFGSSDAALSAPVVGGAAHPAGEGYWLLAEDGRVLPFGAARAHGDIPSRHPQRPSRCVQIRATTSGSGYYILAADGSLFTFGDAHFFGTVPDRRRSNPAVDLALCPPDRADAPSSRDP